jgi:hypothetical protein
MKTLAFAFAALLFGSASSLAQNRPEGGVDKKANSDTNGVSTEVTKSPEDLSREADGLLAKGDWKAAYAVIERAHAAMDGVDLTKIPAWYQQLAFKRGWCALKLEMWKEAGEWFETSYRKYPDPKDNPYHKLALRGWADAAAGAGELELSVRLHQRYLTETSKVDWENPFAGATGRQR